MPEQFVAFGISSKLVSVATRFSVASCTDVTFVRRTETAPDVWTTPVFAIVTRNGRMFPPTRPNAKPVGSTAPSAEAAAATASSTTAIGATRCIAANLTAYEGRVWSLEPSRVPARCDARQNTQQRIPTIPSGTIADKRITRFMICVPEFALSPTAPAA